MSDQRILRVERDRSIPWYETLRKTVRLPGRIAPEVYYAVKPPDYVIVLPRLRDGKVVLVRQYRPVVEDDVVEIPAGQVDPGESPEVAARRELEEETGCVAGPMVFLGMLHPDTGRLANALHAFYAECISGPGACGATAHEEGIEAFAVSPADFAEMIVLGQFRHALDIAVVALAALKGLIQFHELRGAAI
jgi:ADP-ribose pyrophosphatase